ncbi:MAG TPA: YeeE/YedE thiosulfate transporter family protein [Candidatus Omnitrophota bacterium]|nr:YeeE/YedE thiosulfate transporter family protein [Candidatus Omnitrophota bacterium]HQJ14926.1 YeeE/YedE thiosulfate transporter family protein [Candidatus Omnitrophota bacterium]
MNTNLIGLITGIVFGMLLQRSQVIRYDRQINVLLFKDMTIIKFMFSAIIVGMVGVYILKDAGIAKLAVKPAILGAVILGGLLFGAGWALVGYCPATSLAALGEGRVDAFWAVLGMITGAGIFSHIYPFLKKTVLTWADLGKITIPQVLHVNHWVVIPIVIIGVLGLFVLFESK